MLTKSAQLEPDAPASTPEQVPESAKNDKQSDDVSSGTAQGSKPTNASHITHSLQELAEQAAKMDLEDTTQGTDLQTLPKTMTSKKQQV